MINGEPLMTAAQKRQLGRVIQGMRQVNLNSAVAQDEKVRRDLPGKFTANLGDGSATSFVVTHGLKTFDVVVQVRQRSSPYTFQTSGFVVQADSVNSVTITFSSAPSANQYRAIIIG
jgi:hypothetical protein